MTNSNDTHDLAARARRAYERALADHPFIGPIQPLEVAKLERALGSLRPWDREVFLASRVDKLTYREIGARYGMSERSVKRRVVRAYYEVRRFMDDNPVRRWRIWPFG